MEHLPAARPAHFVTFYTTVDVDSLRPYMPDVPVLLPASSWYRRGMKAPDLPSHVSERAADCGGFVASFKWNGKYRYTPADYVRWLKTWKPSWAATMDFCCENEITSGQPGIVAQRQAATTAMANLFWNEYRDCNWSWVPTIQGWTVEDYRIHARQLAPLIDQMQHHYGRSNFRVGIGTLCRRANIKMIHQVVHAVASELPDVQFHLWGVKLGAIQAGLPEQVISVDSAAWHGNFGRDSQKWKASGMKRIEYEWKVALPMYLEKIQAALGVTKYAGRAAGRPRKYKNNAERQRAYRERK